MVQHLRLIVDESLCLHVDSLLEEDAILHVGHQVRGPRPHHAHLPRERHHLEGDRHLRAVEVRDHRGASGGQDSATREQPVPMAGLETHVRTDELGLVERPQQVPRQAPLLVRRGEVDGAAGEV